MGERIIFSINGAESIRYTYLEKEYYFYPTPYCRQKNKNKSKTILDSMISLNGGGETMKVLENSMRIVETRIYYWYLELTIEMQPLPEILFEVAG